MRTLMDCQNAIYPNGKTRFHIWCSKGHKLGDGYIRKEDVDKGKPLVCRICQSCLDFLSFEEGNNDNH